MIRWSLEIARGFCLFVVGPWGLLSGTPLLMFTQKLKPAFFSLYGTWSHDIFRLQMGDSYQEGVASMEHKKSGALALCVWWFEWLVVFGFVPRQSLPIVGAMPPCCSPPHSSITQQVITFLSNIYNICLELDSSHGEDLFPNECWAQTRKLVVIGKGGVVPDRGIL